jgi:opacity protein-like surface antigen
MSNPMRQRSSVRLAAVAVLLLMATVLTAHAADRVKVVRRTGTIRAAASATAKVVAVVAAGTVLDVLGRENGWYKVSVPVGANRTARPGYIEENVAVPTTERAVLVPLGPSGPTGASAVMPQQGGGLRVRGYGEAAFQAFTSSDSFKAIFNNATGGFYGGGVEVGLGPKLFLNAGVTHFRKTGERAFVFEGQAFQLGVADRVQITPITVNVGYRFTTTGRLRPYVGGGAGAVIYRERADFAAEGDDLSKTGPSFQAVGGVEWPFARQVSLAVEGQYQVVRGILGTTGVSEAFSENDLGGASVRVKILFGR